MAIPAMTANSPANGSITWAGFKIQYLGAAFTVAAGSTSSRWVWWKYNTGGTTTQVVAGADLPSDLADDDIVLFGNKNGVPIRVQSTNLIDGDLLVDGSVLTDALGANSVTAEKIFGDVIVANDVYTLRGLFARGSALSGLKYDEDGFLQTDAVGAPRVNFPTDPNLPNIVRSELITDGITAEGRVAFRGVDNEISRNSAVVLQTGTTPPANSPSITLGYWTVDYGFDSNTGSGLTRVGTSWYWMSGFTLRSRTDAGVYSSQTLAFPTSEPLGVGTPISSTVSQPVLVGNVWFVASRTEGGPGYTAKYVYMFNAGNGSYIGKWAIPGSGSNNDSSAYLTVATDGTDIYTAHYDLNADRTVVSRIVNATSDASRGVTQTWTLPAFSGLTRTTRTVFLVGDFDFGSRRFILAQEANIKLYNPATLAETTATEAWQTPTVNGIGWDGVRFWMQTNSRLIQCSKNKTNRVLTGAYTWYDSDAAGGGNFETLLSPIVTVTQLARQSIKVSTPPPADDGTNNAPDSARFYLGTTTSNLRMQAPGAFLNSVTFLDVDPSTGTLPGINPLFPNGTAALIRSAGGTLVMRGDGTMEVSDPLLPNHAANKRYADALVASQTLEGTKSSTTGFATWQRQARFVIVEFELTLTAAITAFNPLATVASGSGMRPTHTIHTTAANISEGTPAFMLVNGLGQLMCRSNLASGTLIAGSAAYLGA